MNKFIENPLRGLEIAIVSLMLVVPAFTQGEPAKPIPQPAPKGWSAPRVPDTPPLPGDVAERSIKVDPNVNVWLPCVSRGSVKITGWNRNEVRVFVEGGTKFIYKVQEKSPASGDPVWIKISGIDPRQKHGQVSDCVWGNEIEIDVPMSATVNLKGQEISTRIDGVKRAEIKSIGGNISVRNIANGISAYAGQGDISVEASNGSIILESTTGNILVFEGGPSEIGDIFKAKTNGGAVSLQGLNHRQVEVNSISGSVSFAGVIRQGGSYNLRTSRGSIRMAIPEGSASQVSATYGYGSFNSEIPIKIITENISEGPIKSIVGTFGTGGEAMIRLTSNNGSIAITKKQP